ncbi:hypothetical protein H2204_012587 [Knufia peltigerae]|uniref:Amidohydrolase-related domain-containing protein n=1 Tax=Knufia peltigerae TaxID=1002370 RepID=A0AA38XTA7_9EURO|nr:hypothetical protein H2204_012587 [Knufia peltigerae]
MAGNNNSNGSTSLLDLEGRPESDFAPLLGHRQKARLVTIEEHAVTPFPTPTVSSTLGIFKPQYVTELKKRLGDVELRLRIMDANRIGAQVISLKQPTAQAFVDLEASIDFCCKANDFVYETCCQRHPTRFFAFATLPTQDGSAAAEELERCVERYDFVGAMVNGFTNTVQAERGLYLDDVQFDSLWRTAERLQTLIFIHPRVPLASNLKVLEDMPIFHGAPYGFGRETVEHVLRLMYSGVFDRFPKLKICIGHMGEGLSWILPRTDSTFRLYTAEAQGSKKKTFQQYFQENVLVNISGMPNTPALMNLMASTQVSNIMFSVDYPYESIAEMRKWFDTIPVADETWKDIGYRNAIRLFRLPLGYDT